MGAIALWRKMRDRSTGVINITAISNTEHFGTLWESSEIRHISHSSQFILKQSEWSNKLISVWKQP
ncbi:MAG: hypothetical protein AAFV90_24265 [Cyanobacteria bacterium J06634_5]